MISAVVGEKREGDRQQHGDGGGRADARQHPDQRWPSSTPTKQ